MTSDLKLYVEGGGDYRALQSKCREGFSSFLKNAGIKNLPRIVACGGRSSAFRAFQIALGQGQSAMLLVDSEEAVSELFAKGAKEEWLPWRHLAQRKGDLWVQPQGATNRDCHLMVQCMESWILCDVVCLSDFFGNGFKKKKIHPRLISIEKLEKDSALALLKSATNLCEKKGAYSKGGHSFELLRQMDPQKVIQASPWADRFIKELTIRL